MAKPLCQGFPNAGSLLGLGLLEEASALPKQFGFCQRQFRCSPGNTQGVIGVENVFLSPASLANASRGARLWLVFAKQDPPLIWLIGLSCSLLESSVGSERVVVEHLPAWGTQGSRFENNYLVLEGFAARCNGLGCTARLKMCHWLSKYFH